MSNSSRGCMRCLPFRCRRVGIKARNALVDGAVDFWLAFFDTGFAGDDVLDRAGLAGGLLLSGGAIMSASSDCAVRREEAAGLDGDNSSGSVEGTFTSSAVAEIVDRGRVAGS